MNKEEIFEWVKKNVLYRELEYMDIIDYEVQHFGILVPEHEHSYFVTVLMKSKRGISVKLAVIEVRTLENKMRVAQHISIWARKDRMLKDIVLDLSVKHKVYVDLFIHTWPESKTTLKYEDVKVYRLEADAYARGFVVWINPRLFRKFLELVNEVAGEGK